MKIPLVVGLTLTVIFVLLHTNKLLVCPLSAEEEEKRHVDLSLSGTPITKSFSKKPSPKVDVSPSVQQDNNNDSNKPTLFFHVGPRKTGTTTIQAILNNKEFSKPFAMDNVTVVRGCGWKQTEEVYYCLINPNCTDDHESIRHFKQSVDNLYPPHPSYKVIHSAETFSYFPIDHDRTIRLMRSFQNKWNVRVVLAYRPLLSWLASDYTQDRRGNFWVNKKFAPYSYNQRGTNLTFPQHFEQRFQLGVREADYLHTYRAYSQLFGKDAIVQLDMKAPQGLSEEFLCRGINATAACEYQKTLKEERENDNSFAHPDHDLLVLHAHEMGLIRGKRFVERHDATLVLEKKMQENNLTMEDLPRACLDEKQMEIYWNRASQEEEISPFVKSRVEEAKPTHLPSLCSIDPASTLANETLRALLFPPSSYQLKK